MPKQSLSCTICRNISRQKNFNTPQQAPFLSLRPTPPVSSGHSKWSTIKHAKARADSQKSAVRSTITQSLMQAVRANDNAQIAALTAAAKKASVPKAVIEGAIARGQGSSFGSGEGGSVHGSRPTLFECRLPTVPGSIGFLVEVHSGDSQGSTLLRLRTALKRLGGIEGKTRYLFAEKGWVQGEMRKGVEVEDIECAVEGVGEFNRDADMDESTVIVRTEVSNAGALAQELDDYLNDVQVGIGFIAENGLQAEAQGESAHSIREFIEGMQKVEGVREVHCNATFKEAA